MQLRIYVHPVQQLRIVERWIHRARRWVRAEEGGTHREVCSIADHDQLKADLERFRRLPFAGYQDAGDGLLAELRNCEAVGCGSTLSLMVDADGNPCEGSK
jgi:hypothetical protein